MVGTVGKVNVALTRLPVINGFPQSAQAMVDIGSGMERLHQSHRATTRGHLGPIWAELYPQTAYDPTVAPEDVHVVSCFVQHLPYSWADGRSWDHHRERVGQRVISMIEEWSPGFSDTILHCQVVGPPDIEAKTGLTGGHIFRAIICPGTHGISACPTAHPWTAFTYAAPLPTREEASSQPAAATPQSVSWPTFRGRPAKSLSDQRPSLLPHIGSHVPGTSASCT